MTTATQQISSNPALDFANAVLEETDGAREIIFMLHDIAQGVRENATTNDRMKASGSSWIEDSASAPNKHLPPADKPRTPIRLPPKTTSRKPRSNPNPPGWSPSSTAPCTSPSDLHPKHTNPPVIPAKSGNPAASPESFDPYSIQPSSSTFSKSPTAVGHS